MKKVETNRKKEKNTNYNGNKSRTEQTAHVKGTDKTRKEKNQQKNRKKNAHRVATLALDLQCAKRRRQASSWATLGNCSACAKCAEIYELLYGRARTGKVDTHTIPHTHTHTYTQLAFHLHPFWWAKVFALFLFAS